MVVAVLPGANAFVLAEDGGEVAVALKTDAGGDLVDAGIGFAEEDVFGAVDAAFVDVLGGAVAGEGAEDVAEVLGCYADGGGEFVKADRAVDLRFDEIKGGLEALDGAVSTLVSIALDVLQKIQKELVDDGRTIDSPQGVVALEGGEGLSDS